ncbi:hypothetical protein MNBD_GAMMA12-2792 [hydrothermal vent metagenome]|uniref:Uncharacterized protein n=1 Tax=hydrothermal vent metagenome TaxID=652676 RepID=A0A3B0Z216_9ZZZZ
MDKECAKNRLLIHGSAVANHEEWHNCFIGQLKPYRGRLDDSVYMDIVNCLLTVIEEINTGEPIDARIVTGVHGILYIGSLWLFDSESGLRKSYRIENGEVIRLQKWINNISSMYHNMLWYKPEEQYLLEKYSI